MKKILKILSQFIFKDRIYFKAPKGYKSIILTFDDGPYPQYTEKILDILKEHDVKASFFLSGKEVEKYPELARRIRDNGHNIESHGFLHNRMKSCSYKDISTEIEKANEIIYRATGACPEFFRPPYGELSINIFRAVFVKNMRLAMWSIDSGDSSCDTPDRIIAKLDKVRAGDVVLLHEDYLHTVEALPDIIKNIKSKGLDFAFISELNGEKMGTKNHREVRFILQYFHPEVASTAQLMTELAEGLVADGFKIRVLSGQPTYVKSEKIDREEVYRGIEIKRVSCTRFDKNSSLGRLMNWLSYTFLVFTKLLFSKDRTPLFIVSTPPFLFVVGYLLKKIRNQNYVCLVYDLYPDIAIKLGFMKKNSFVGKIWNECNKHFFKNASFVIVPSENMKTLIEEKIGRDGDKVKVIYNWADGEFLKPIPKEENWFSKQYDLVDKLVVLYAGNMGLFHQLETLVEAADKLKENKGIKFLFIGEGGKKKKLMDMVAEKKIDNVIFLPYQDKSILPYSLTCSDVSVVSLEKSLNCVAAPCKLYTSLAAGQIILGLVDKTSEVATIVNKYECGFCTEQDNVDRVVEVLNILYSDKELREKLKIKGRRCFEENFQKQKAIDEYNKIFTKLN